MSCAKDTGYTLDVTDPNIDRLAGTSLGDIRSLGKPVILLLNKMDRVTSKREVLPLIGQFNALGIFQEIVPASGLKGENTDDLIEAVTKYLPYGEPFYDPDMLSEQPQRFFVSELIRERVLEQYRQEIPYSVEVNIVEFKERPEPEKLFISAEIIVERDSQKGILIGKKGEALKQLGARARQNVEEFLGQGVYLELFVKVRKDWRSDESRLKGFGY